MAKNPNEPNAPTGTGPPAAYGPSEAPQVDYSGDAGKVNPGGIKAVGAPTAQPPEDLGTPSGWSYSGPLSNKPAPSTSKPGPDSGGNLREPNYPNSNAPLDPNVRNSPGSSINPPIVKPASAGNDGHTPDFHGLGSKLPGTPLPAMPRIPVEGQPHIAGHPFGITSRRKRGGYHPPERMG